MYKIVARFLIGFTALLASVVFVPDSIQAQGGNQIQQRLGQEIDATQDIIERAQDVVSVCQNQRGRELLKAAVVLQESARNQASSSPMNSYTMTRRARNKALEAIKACQEVAGNSNLVELQLEKTERLMEQIREYLGSGSGRIYESVFNTARENQRQAREFFRNRQYLPSLKLSRQAENSLAKLAEQLRTQNGIENRLKNQFRQFEANRDRVFKALDDCDNEQAFQLARQAREAYNDAVDFASEGKWMRAENSFKMARKFLGEANELCAQSGTLERMFRQLQADIEQNSEAIRLSGNDKAEELLREAVRYLEKADGPCREGQSELCAANLRAAQLNLQKAKRLAGI